MTVWRLIYPMEQVAEERIAPSGFIGELDPCPIWVRGYGDVLSLEERTIFYLQEGRVYRLSKKPNRVAKALQIYPDPCNCYIPFDPTIKYRTYLASDYFQGVEVLQNTVLPHYEY